MADAIPVHSAPKKAVKVVPASPALDEAGNVVAGEYVARAREGLDAEAPEGHKATVTEVAANPGNGAAAFTRTDW